MESRGAQSSTAFANSLLFIAILWACGVVVLAAPVFVALAPGTRGLGYLPELGALGWTVLLLLGGVWLLVLLLLVRLTRAWAVRRRYFQPASDNGRS